MRSTEAFQTWFNNEVANGLVDIKLAVFPGRDVTAEAIQSEILVAETMLKFKMVRAEPQPKQAEHERAMGIFSATTIQ